MQQERSFGPSSTPRSLFSKGHTHPFYLNHQLVVFAHGRGMVMNLISNNLRIPSTRVECTLYITLYCLYRIFLPLPRVL